MNSVVYFLESLFLTLHLLSLRLYALLLLLKLLYVFHNAAIQLLTSSRLELLIGLVFIHIYDLLLHLAFFLGRLSHFRFFFEFIPRDVN